jgi:3'-phosphoadenosine 5'-phosphosulfate sulfotransferase (PAPS reductase)/FAD synthetase
MWRRRSMPNQVRHILGISGGKDSAALAVYMHEKLPELEYFFCDTGKELKETYDYLGRLEARLNITILRLSAERDFDHWLDVYGGVLPSPSVRWCTKALKIEPLERYVGDDHAVSYVAIRADERDRKGYISTKPNISAEFPFIDAGITKADVETILKQSGIGLPEYYKWRSRSGCFFCFFQQKIEWIRLHDQHPDLFEQAVAYEETRGGAGYTWTANETLKQLVKRRAEVEADYEKRQERLRIKRTSQLRMFQPDPNRPLAEILTDFLDGDEGGSPCIICHV